MKHWILSAVVLSAGPVLAVVPGSWQSRTEADFSSGEFDKTAVSSRGEISLARAVKVLLPAQEAPVVVAAVAVVGKDLYAAAGSSSEIYRITGPKAAKFATVPGTIVTCLAPSGKTLLAGTGGKGAGVYSVSADASGPSQPERRAFSMPPPAPRRRSSRSGRERPGPSTRSANTPRTS